MVEGVLIGILGNSIYTLIQSSIDSVTNHKDEDLYERIYDSLENSSKVFFEYYSSIFPSPEDTFLARKENVDLLLTHFFHNHDAHLYTQINREGFNGSETLTDEQLNFFLETLHKEIRKDHKLNQIMSEKKHHKQMDKVEKNSDKILELLTPETKNTDKKPKSKWSLKDEKTGKPIEYVEGKKQTFSFPNGVQYTLLMRDYKIYIDFLDEYGKTHYFEIDENMNVKNLKFPFSLSDYELDIEKSEILNERIHKNSNGYTKLLILKWGREATIFYSENWELQGIECRGGWGVNHNKKTIFPSDL